MNSIIHPIEDQIQGNILDPRVVQEALWVVTITEAGVPDALKWFEIFILWGENLMDFYK